MAIYGITHAIIFLKKISIPGRSSDLPVPIWREKKFRGKTRALRARQRNTKKYKDAGRIRARK
jgi:hypothetical protein